MDSQLPVLVYGSLAFAAIAIIGAAWALWYER